MFVRSHADAESVGNCVEWGGGSSHRLLTDSDAMGFTICHTVVRPGTKAKLEYTKHLEACYCISGQGQVVDETTGQVHDIVPGTLYVLDKHDPHILCNTDDQDFVLVSVFNPPLTGREVHTLSDGGYSGY